MSNASLVAAATGSQQARAAANNPRGVSALLYACQQGDVDKVRRILRAQPNAYLERDRTGKSALHYCCTSDRISAAQAADVLVMAAPDLVESRDEDGFTPLHLAVIAGNMPLVTFLLANNADINSVDNEKHTVVHWATVCGETVALRAVLAAGAPVSTPDVHGGYPLHYAAQMCGGEKDSTLGLQVLYTLLSHEDISVSVEDGDGRPPLLWAASAGSAKAVLALIRAGSAVESHDKDGLTALHCAASRGHTDCIDTLLTLCGASPDVIDSNGCTALHYAVTLGHADATALLLAHSADPNRQDRKGRSPAHCGCAKGQFETLKMLGGQGANLWLRNARGDLPLHEAAASGRRDLVRWLLEARPSQVNARNNDGRCPLHLAALNDNADMCKILIDAGAQINPVLRTSKNAFMTPLDCALQRGFRSTAKYLQLHGGIPANRLTGVSQGAAVGSAVSLHIRDDVTLWGDTSSETEKEDVGKPKSKKKTYKRKLNYKYEKKKMPISASENESAKVSTGKVESNATPKTKDVGKAQDSNADKKEGGYHTDFPFLSGSNIPPGEIFIYANEVNINDKFGGVRIQQNGEFTATEPTKLPEVVDHSIPVPQETTKSVKSSASSINEKQDRRPKSAKYGRLKNKSAGSSEKTDSARRKTHADTPDPRRKQDDEVDSPHKNGNLRQPTLKDKSGTRDAKATEANTTIKKAEEPTKSLEIKGARSPNEKTTAEPPSKREAAKASEKPQRSEKPRITQQDQQSARSNTSYEDGEDHKELVVEASVHSPPREVSEKTPSPTKTLDVSDIPDEKRRTPIGSERLSENDIEKIKSNADQVETSREKEIVKAGHALQATEVIITTPSDTEATTQGTVAPPSIIKHSSTVIEVVPSTAEEVQPITETAASIAGTTALIAETATAIAQAASDKEQKSADVLKQEREEIVQTDKLSADTANDVNTSVVEASLPTAATESPAAPAAPAAAGEAIQEHIKKENLIKTSASVADADESKLKQHVEDSAMTDATSKTTEIHSESQQPITADKEIKKEDKGHLDQQKEMDAHLAITPNDKTTEEPTQPTMETTKELAKTQNTGVDFADDNKLIEKQVPAVNTKDEVKSKEKRIKREAESETSSDVLSPTRRHKREETDQQPMPTETGKRQKQKSDYKKRRKAVESPDKSKDASRKSGKSSKAPQKEQSVSQKRLKSPPDSSIDAKSSEESEEETSPGSSSPSSMLSVAEKEHRSFKVLGDDECTEETGIQREKQRKSFRKRSSPKKPRAQSEESRSVKIAEQVNYKEHERLRRSKIPTPVNLKTPLSKSDKHLDYDRKAYSSVQHRVPSLPNIHDSSLKHSRSISNLSAPLASTYSDNDHETGSDGEEVSSATRKKRLRKRSKTRGAKSAGSDYESSNLIDSGFEPSPRSSRIPKWKNMTERGVNMTSVTQTIQSNIRRYHLERKIFQHLLDLKRLQIRSGQHNEAVLVKRAIDAYHRSCAATVGAGRYISQDYSFKNFEQFLYNSLRKIQKNGSEHLHGLPETPRNPLFCTQSTHRCDHATHAYTGVPCAAYLPKMDHHTIPKIGFECKPAGFLPKIAPKNTVTLELCHGNDKQVISLPAERLDQNKRYYVTFTVKGGENNSTAATNEANAKVSSASHVHSKSD